MTKYERLKQIIDEIDILISINITSSEPNFQAWKTNAERFIINNYGQDSYEHKNFSNTYFCAISFARNVSHREQIDSCRRGLEKTKAIFLTYLEELDDSNSDNDGQNLETVHEEKFTKIFIVHGHDSGLKHEVARLVEKQDLTAVILSEQANTGKTIIEKIEKYSDVSGAICLFTADDLGHAKAVPTEQSRARQNVVLETGYFMGRLGRNRVVILADEGIEMPSDLSGVVYTDTKSWQIDLLKELKSIGYTVDFNKLF